MAKNGIVIDGEKYVKASDVVIKAPEGERLMLVCVDNRGLLFIGKVNLNEKKSFLTIRDARCVIYWGTTKHIAEITTGPTSKTRLGDKCDIIIKKENIVFAYDAEAEGWCNHV